MIEHVYRRAAAAPGVDAVLVATDDARIAAAVERFGGEVAMTGTHASGTDRIAEAVATRPCAIVVNVQGDEPLLEPEMIGEALAPLLADPAVRMSTLRRPLTDPADYVSPHVVKVVVDRAGDALYFSRSPIPFVREPDDAASAAAGRQARSGTRTTDVSSGIRPPEARDGLPPAFGHIGLYAYRRDLLLWLAALPRTPLEIAESLEQLRALEHGVRIRAVPTRYEAIGVDTPGDLERVRRRLQHATSSAAPPAGGRGDPAPAAARAHEVA